MTQWAIENPLLVFILMWVLIVAVKECVEAVCSTIRHKNTLKFKKEE